ncbi:hypothetical protein DLAC_02073 [Tieghemostelium lacteum]|uniref:Phosphoglycerate mutase family protein n=1 Tax=Tieghemostelium lacteum TaxID=361077 RepID=A0A152A4I4_TIELA|nr:hypothetical protein DLAC_02073 [Tieghemostelium lacteum]|eukprot:KYR00997.1 hypothetical protein DLAC_02073 [Tieghemostelium lacteum]
MSTIYLTRHGLREDWVNKLWKNTAERVSDTPLSKEGFVLANELGSSLVGSGITQIISSPMERCVQTSTAIAEKLNIPIKIDYGVAEYIGPNPKEEDELKPLTVEQLHKLYKYVDLEYKSSTDILPGKETLQDLHVRCKKCIDILKERFAGQTIIIVTHAATLIALGRAVVDDIEYQFRTGVCSLTKASQDPENNNKWFIEYSGKVDHLSGGEQYHWQMPVLKK